MYLITEFKRCRCCQETLPASAFTFVRANLALASYCKPCHCAKQKRRRDSNPERAKEIQAKSRVKNRDAILEGKKRWYYGNKEEIRAQQKAHYEANKERLQTQNKASKIAHGKNWPSSSPEYMRQYRLDNAEHLREINRLWLKARLETDPAFKILRRLRTRVYHALKGRSKSARTIELLGCLPVELFAYLEKQFRPGMTWENYGPVWHVDHIRPCDSFSDLSDPAQQRECFHFSNLQPLFASENLRKHATYVSSE